MRFQWASYFPFGFPSWNFVSFVVKKIFHTKYYEGKSECWIIFTLACPQQQMMVMTWSQAAS